MTALEWGMATRPKRPRDVNQLAKLIVDISTGQTTDDLPLPEKEKNQKAVALSRLGAHEDGHARIISTCELFTR